MIEEELKVPYVDRKIVEYLEQNYDSKNLLEHIKTKCKNADEGIGFMKGVQDVVDRFYAIIREQEGD